MKRFGPWTLPTVVLFNAVFFLGGCAGAEGDAGDSAANAEGANDNVAGVEEVAAIPVDDPCDCFGEGLSRGEMRFCRESKRNVSFLEALRKCGTGEVTGVSAIMNIPGDGQYTMNTEQSVLQWRGTKAGGMAEAGTVPFRSCVFSVEEGRLVSGEVLVEMSGIQATSVEGLAARNLGQHLRGEDFFDVSEFPTAAFSVESGKVGKRGSLDIEGKLNIKGISKPASASLSFGSSDPVVASIDMTFNRADFDVRYGSGSFFDNLGDDLISDEVSLKMVLVEDVTKRKSN